MGDWSNEPWGTDEAADWFQSLWKDCNFSKLIEEINNFNPKEERYEAIRAAGYILETLGIPYVWPTAYMSELKALLQTTISILENMLSPPNQDWGFLDSWGEDPDIIRSVQAQINCLKKRVSDLA